MAERRPRGEYPQRETPKRGDPWVALLARLRLGMRDGFAALSDPEYTRALPGLVVDVLTRLDEVPAQLDAWRREVLGWGELGRQERSVLVARGVRLCLTHGPAQRPAKTSTSRSVTSASAARTRAAPLPPAVAVAEAVPEVGALRGVGPSTVAKLRARGLHTVLDLVYLLPLGYRDHRNPRPIAEVEDGHVAVVTATCGSLRQGFARGRFMATLQLHAEADHGGTVAVAARWFHRVGGLDRFTNGQRVVAVGPVRRFKGQLTMAHPELRLADEPGPTIGVRYPLVEGIAPRTLARLIDAALEHVEANPQAIDALPPEIATRHALPRQFDALRQLHRPSPELDAEAVVALAEARSPAHRRLAFDEFFFFQLAMLIDRQALRTRPGAVAPTSVGPDRERLRACIPFEPTTAQWRVSEEIAADMQSGQAMLRLLQGDVGSGKTVVAFAAAVGVVDAGGQVAVMAPTEILAEQHLRTLQPWCERAGIRVALLTGTTGRAERNSLLSLLAAGRIDIVVGTHALLTGDVNFANLGLAVVDEQHRFGVEQRAVLRQKGGLCHLLVMTATPIPRTLALCAYGELDVSVIDELPPGRRPPLTRLFPGAKGLDRSRRALIELVRAGGKAFVVCPLVEASEVLEVTDVEATAAGLAALLPGKRIDTIHGRMSGRDKAAKMTAFRAGTLDVLVATTVIEVGVDVPDARVMMIEHAERFGLAALHQLRGRVGRGGQDADCIIHTVHGPQSEVAKRLRILTETSDGFVVAERDLALRGPGELFGTRQAGAPRLRFAGFAGEGTTLLVAAREAAATVLRADPQLAAHPEVLAELHRRKAAHSVFAGDAG